MVRRFRPRSSQFAALAVVALVVAAGVAGFGDAARSAGAVPTASSANASVQETTTANETPASESTAPNVSVRDGSLPVDPGRVFADVQDVLGTNVMAPRYVQVVDDSAELGGSGNVSAAVAPRFWRLVGVVPEPAFNETERDQLENGLTTGLGGIVLYPGVEPTPATVKPLLAHEYVHYVQFVEERDVEVSAAVDTSTTDGQYVRRSVLEGAAVYATDRYVARYAETSRPNSERYPDLQRKLSPGSLSWHGNTAYIYGHRYFESRLDSPSRLHRVYDDPPTTSEQVIHGLSPATEPPSPLSIEVRSDGPWRSVGADRMGEAFVRSALANGVSVDRATSAAAGWGNDTLRVFRSPDRSNSSYVWVLRWDDAANASEFAATFREYLDSRGNESSNGTWRMRGRTVDVRSPAERTTVVAFGPPSFTRQLQVTATGERVVVRPGSSQTTRETTEQPPADFRLRAE